MGKGWVLWTGRAIAAGLAFLFAMSASMKFAGGKEVAEGMAHLGLPESLVATLGVVEVASLVVYLVPQTAVLGAILLTGYLGGAILAHLRVGDPVTTPLVIGVLVWLSLWLRDPRLVSLMPLRRD